MRIGICTSIDGLADAKAAGYAFAELAVAALAPTEDDAAFAPIRERILAAPIAVEAFNCFVPANIKVTGPNVDNCALARHMDIALSRAASVGGKRMVFGSGGARTAPEGFPKDQAKAQYLKAALMAAEIGAKYGVVIALEPLSANECNIFNYVSEGADYVDRGQHPNLQLLADSYHMGTLGEPYSHLLDADGRLKHVHIDTHVMPGLNGGNTYDLEAFLLTLKHAGYEGRVSVEDHSNMLNAQQSVSRVEMYRMVYEFVAARMPA